MERKFSQIIVDEPVKSQIMSFRGVQRREIRNAFKLSPYSRNYKPVFLWLLKRPSLSIPCKIYSLSQYTQVICLFSAVFLQLKHLKRAPGGCLFCHALPTN